MNDDFARLIDVFTCDYPSQIYNPCAMAHVIVDRWRMSGSVLGHPELDIQGFDQDSLLLFAWYALENSLRILDNVHFAAVVRFPRQY